MSGRPRRKAAMKQGHIESGGEQYHLDQVSKMKKKVNKSGHSAKSNEVEKRGKMRYCSYITNMINSHYLLGEANETRHSPEELLYLWWVKWHLSVSQIVVQITSSNISRFSCRFQPNCSKTYQRGEMMSLSAHLLIHVRDACERSVKNPKFYENLIFHSVPIDKQVIVLTYCFVFVDHRLIDWNDSKEST